MALSLSIFKVRETENKHTMVKTTSQTVSREARAGLKISPQIKSNLSETYKWTNFLAIVGFIAIAFIALAAIFMGIVMSNKSTEFGTASTSPALIAFVYVVVAAAFAYPLSYLYRFSRRMKKALASNDQEALDASFKQLTNCHRMLGLLVLGSMIAAVAIAFNDGNVWF